MDAQVMQRPWLAHYPKNVAHTIDVASLGTVADMVTQACTAYAERPAF